MKRQGHKGLQLGRSKGPGLAVWDPHRASEGRGTILFLGGGEFLPLCHSTEPQVDRCATQVNNDIISRFQSCCSVFITPYYRHQQGPHNPCHQSPKTCEDHSSIGPGAPLCSNEQDNPPPQLLFDLFFLCPLLFPCCAGS